MDMTATPLATPTRTPQSPPWRPWPFRTPSWRLAIAGSGLPAAVQQVLLEVVGNTRLMADEKLEVAEELIAHFEDGLQRGRDSDSLIEAFGDPEIASQLIRNGKQRTRSMRNRLVQGALWLGALSVGSFLTLVIIFYMGKPQPSVDYLAVINKPALQAADHSKGWTVYRDLWIKHGFSEGGTFNIMNFFLIDEHGSGVRLLRPGDGEAWQAVTKILAEIEDLLEGFRVGALRPSFGVPFYFDLTQYSEADFQAINPSGDYQQLIAEKQTRTDRARPETLSDLPFSHLQVMRHSARILTVDTRWAIEQGDLERATRNIEAMLGISSQVAESKFLVCTFIGYAINAMALDLIDECVSSNVSFTDQHLERIHTAVAKVRAEEMIDINTERAMFMDLIQKTYTDNGQGDGRITAAGVALLKEGTWLHAEHSNQKQESSIEYVVRQAVAPTSILFTASRKQLTDKADEIFARVDKWLKSPADEETLKSIYMEINDLPSSYQVLKLLFPPVFQARQATIRAQVNAGSVSAALAVIRYQREHGRLPESLDELVDKYLDRVPLDPFDNLPLRYLPLGDEFQIYSVGVNRVDDGGQPVLVRSDGSFVGGTTQERTSELVGSVPHWATLMQKEQPSYRVVSGGKPVLVHPDGPVVTDPDQDDNSESLRPLPARSYLFHNKYPGDWILWPRLSGQDN